MGSDELAQYRCSTEGSPGLQSLAALTPSPSIISSIARIHGPLPPLHATEIIINDRATTATPCWGAALPAPPTASVRPSTTQQQATELNAPHNGERVLEGGERSSPEGDGGSIDRRTRPHASGTSCNTSTSHLSNVFVRCGPQKQTAVQKGKQNPTPVDPPE